MRRKCLVIAGSAFLAAATTQATWAGPLEDLAAGYTLMPTQERPLEELVPGEDPAPAGLGPEFWEGLPEEPGPAADLVFGTGGLAPAGAGPDSAAGPEAQSPVPSSAPAAGGFLVTEGSIPAGWTELSQQGATYALPPDWQLVSDKDGGRIFFGGDIASRSGPGFGIGVMEDVEKTIADMTVLARDMVTVPGGQTYHRVVYEVDLDKKTRLRGVMFLSELPVSEDGHMTANVMVFSGSPEDHAEVFSQILGTLRLPPPGSPATPETGQALGGVLRYTLPVGWSTLGRVDETRLVLRPEIYSGYGHYARGAGVTGDSGLLQLVPPGAATDRDVLYGNWATRYDWTGQTPEFLDGARMVSGQYRLFVLEECLDGNEPLALLLAGVPAFFESEAVRGLLEDGEFDLPWAAQPCAVEGQSASRPLTAEEQLGFAADGTRLESGPEHAETAQGGRVPGAQAAQPGKVPSTGMAATAGPAQQEAPGRSVSVGAASFLLPEGWQPQWDNPDDKGFASADGKLTILAFWWFPDEPLTGYEDVIQVENTVVDHEPVTVIRSDFGTRIGIQTVTERARADGKRFIFTVEGETDWSVLAPLQASLISTLSYGGSFDGGGGSKGAGAEPGAVSGPAPEPAPRAGRREDLRVSFAGGGTGGWSGQSATLSNPGFGGPDGGGYLSIHTPGDGITGYVVAPDALLGDWSGYAAVRTVMITGTGRPVGAYDYGGVGDIRVSNGAMSASAVYRQPVGPGWTTQEISFEDPGAWRLEGGARSLGDVLANVTRVELRAEFLEGDARAGLAEVLLVAGSQPAADVQPVNGAAVMVPQPPVPHSPVPQPPIAENDRFEDQGGGYTRYINDRYGTHITYPGSYFTAEPPPANGDGRRFVSIDGAASFYVFAQYNALALSPAEQMAQDLADGRGTATYQRQGAGWYVLSGITGDHIYYRRVLEDGDGLLRVFEITYPAARKAEFNAVVSYMAQSFGPEGSQRPAGGAVSEPADPSPAGSTRVGLPANDLGCLGTPKRGSAERRALMDAARIPIQNEIGSPVIFVVDVLRTDGRWAYLQGKPVNPDGTPINWRKTRFAREIANGVMSDVVMVLMANTGGGWQVVDHVLGPTDVHWVLWTGQYGLPERLFAR